jgi:adenylate cyclase
MAEKGGERRLAAILSADIVGYSRLIGLDEEGTLARVNAHRREFLEPTVAEHRGRIVKRTGDGALVEFISAVDAARCAIQVQRGMTQRNAGASDNERIQLRIGINLGDIVIEENDIFGDGVNIAVRLEAIAPSGGICISEDVYRQVRDKVDVQFQDIGEQKLKNITRSVRVYKYPLHAITTSTANFTDFVLPDKPSIAVLPFQNMSGDAEQDYFCDGMVEDIALRRLIIQTHNRSPGCSSQANPATPMGALKDRATSWPRTF